MRCVVACFLLDLEIMFVKKVHYIIGVMIADDGFLKREEMS